MKVSELIKELEAMPQDAQVKLYTYGHPVAPTEVVFEEGVVIIAIEPPGA